ncbi:MAG: helix-turn-helix domain-containing protein [Minisyncoccia bacterium]
MNRQHLEQALSYSGLSGKEASVYLTSLGIKKPTPLSVAKGCGIPRPTVYREMESLVKKGLMGKVKENERVVYVPEDPRTIVEKLKLQTSSIQNVMTELRDLATIYRNRPTVRFFEGHDSIRRIFEDIFLVEDEEVLAFTSIKELFKVFPDYYSLFVKRRIKRKIRGRIITPKDSEGEKLRESRREEFRDIRFIPDKLAEKIGIIGGHMLIYKDRVALVSFDTDQTSVIIENQALANVQRSLFEVAWESLK